MQPIDKMIVCPFQVLSGKRVYGLRNSNLFQINGSRPDFRRIAEVSVVYKYLCASEISRSFKSRSLKKFDCFAQLYFGEFSQSCIIDCTVYQHCSQIQKIEAGLLTGIVYQHCSKTAKQGGSPHWHSGTVSSIFEVLFA